MSDGKPPQLALLMSTKHQLALVIRLQQWLVRKRVPGAGVICRWLGSLTYMICASEIAPTAVVPPSTRFPHPTGIVIGAGVRLGERVTIYQNVTLGSHGRADMQQAYPTVGDDTVIFAGAVIVGGVNVGCRSVIGANAVIRRDVAPDSVVLAPQPEIRPRRS